jgi:hypothetical protein
MVSETFSKRGYVKQETGETFWPGAGYATSRTCRVESDNNDATSRSLYANFIAIDSLSIGILNNLDRPDILFGWFVE